MTDTVTEPEAPEAEETPREPCACGCGGYPTRKRSRFLPGHDAQLKAALYRVIRDDDATDEAKADAVARLESFGWPQPVERKAKAKTVKADEETPNEGE